MSAPFSDAFYGRLSTFCERIYDLLITNQEALGLADVFYGDQQQIPRTPAACVEPDKKSRELSGNPRMTTNNMSAYVLLYVSKLTDPQDNARQALEVGEAVETLLHADPTLGGFLVHSYVTSVEPGYRARGNSQFRACRIEFQGFNKTMLGM
jgi:hypothetical protein